MTRGARFRTATFVALIGFIGVASNASAAQCGNTAAGFEAWKQQFAAEAKGRGSQPWGRRVMQRQPSQLTAAKRVSAYRLISFLRNVAVQALSRADVDSSNPTQRCLLLSSNAMASRQGLCLLFGVWRRHSEANAGIRTLCRP